MADPAAVAARDGEEGGGGGAREEQGWRGGAPLIADGEVAALRIESIGRSLERKGRG